jgi:hypothetical protein
LSGATVLSNPSYIIAPTIYDAFERDGGAFGGK